MPSSNACPACDGILVNGHVELRTPTAVRVVSGGSFAALWFVGDDGEETRLVGAAGSRSASSCTACGLVLLRGGEDLACFECGARMSGADTRCASCGWSYLDPAGA